MIFPLAGELVSNWVEMLLFVDENRSQYSTFASGVHEMSTLLSLGVTVIPPDGGLAELPPPLQALMRKADAIASIAGERAARFRMSSRRVFKPISCLAAGDTCGWQILRAQIVAPTRAA
jgi:hypothetical protein